MLQNSIQQHLARSFSKFAEERPFGACHDQIVGSERLRLVGL